MKKVFKLDVYRLAGEISGLILTYLGNQVSNFRMG